MKIAGIDYSMACPCICIHDTSNKPFGFRHCKFYFVTDKKYLGEGWITENIHVKYLNRKDFNDDIKRYSALSYWAMQHLTPLHTRTIEHVALEGYSMGSRGKVFNIGENTGILKHNIRLHNIPLTIYAPKEIKMFAVNNTPLDFTEVNKNKIDKDHMYSIFLDEVGVDLRAKLTPKKKKIDSPVGDIVDSFYICKLLRENIVNQSIQL